MPDISMCKYDKCKSKEECYRYKAMPFKFGQCYIVWDKKEKKLIDIQGKCDIFWKYE